MCSALVRAIVEEDVDEDADENDVTEDNAIVLSTLDARTAALRLYFDMGFQPIFRATKVDRWQRACAEIGVRFLPSEWAWPRA